MSSHCGVAHFATPQWRDPRIGTCTCTCTFTSTRHRPKSVILSEAEGPAKLPAKASPSDPFNPKLYSTLPNPKPVISTEGVAHFATPQWRDPRIGPCTCTSTRHRPKCVILSEAEGPAKLPAKAKPSDPFNPKLYSTLPNPKPVISTEGVAHFATPQWRDPRIGTCTCTFTSTRHRPKSVILSEAEGPAKLPAKASPSDPFNPKLYSTLPTPKSVISTEGVAHFATPQWREPRISTLHHPLRDLRALPSRPLRS